MKKLFIISLFAISNVALANPKNITLHYTMTWGGIEIGEITDVLEFNEGKYEINSYAKSIGLAKLLNQKGVNRYSRGSYDEKGQLVSDYYQQERDGEIRKSEIDYATQNVVITNEEGNVLEEDIIHERVLDSLSVIYEFYTTNDLSFNITAPASENKLDNVFNFFPLQVTDGKKLTVYKFVPDEETSMVETGMGEMESLRFERITTPDKKYQFWFSTEHNYIPARISLERGNSHIEFILAKIGSEETDTDS